ncbi:MAG: LysR family transcriptional regulator [Polyangiaceae bacterium]|nr:LysR family transcriptional regulator [Polyangiaceae bacterium]
MGFYQPRKEQPALAPLFAERGLSLDRLRSFLEVAEAGSIARASQGDPVRQSQLSRQLSELEGFFGCALTERRKGRRVLTDAGERLAEHVRWTFSGLLEIKRGVGEVSAPPLVLAAGDSVLHWLVLPRIASVEARFSVSALPVHDVVSGLGDGSVDIGIVRRDEVPQTLESTPLGEVEHALFVPRAIAPRGVPDDELPFVVPIAAQVSDRDFVAKMIDTAARSNKTLTITLRCETFPQVFRAVQSGRYAGLLPTLARAELGASRYREVAFGGRHRSSLRLAWSPTLVRVRPSAARTIERLKEVLRAPK